MRIYVRERQKSNKGDKQPRFRVVAIEGGNVNMHVKHFKKMELEKISKDIGADLIYLVKDELPHHSESKKEKVKAK